MPWSNGMITLGFPLLGIPVAGGQGQKAPGDIAPIVGGGIPSGVLGNYVVDILCPSTQRQTRLRAAPVTAGSVYTFDPVSDGGGPVAATADDAIRAINAWWGTPKSMPVLQYIDTKCQQNPAGFQPPPQQQPPSEQPPQQQPPAPQQQPPAPQSIQVTFLVSCESKSTVAVQTSDIDTIATLVGNGWTAVSTDNYATWDGAVQYLKDHEQDYITKAQCPEKVIGCPGFPTDICKQFNALEVGSVAWCQALDALAQQFSDIGTWFLTNVLGIDMDKGCPCPNTPATDTLNPISAMNVTTGLTDLVAKSIWEVEKPLVQAGVLAVKTMGKSFLHGIGINNATADAIADNFDLGQIIAQAKSFMCESWWKLVKCNPCNVTLLMGLHAARAFVELFNEIGGDMLCGVRFFGEAWVKLKFKIPLGIKPLRQTLDYLTNWVCPAKILGEQHIVEMYIKQVITKEHATCMFKMHGYPLVALEQAIDSKRKVLAPREVISLTKRRPDLKINVDDWLQRDGWIRDEEKTAVKELYWEIPKIGDHLHWLARNIDHATYAATFGLWQGFSSKEEVIEIYKELQADPNTTDEQKQDIDAAINIITLQPISPALQGRNFYATFKRDLESQGLSRRNAFFHYLAHWQALPREIGAEMVQRLRPGRVDPDLVFTVDMYRRSLIEQDIDPRLLDRYIALSYRTLNQRYIQLLAHEGLIDKTGISERLQDIGFKPEESGLLADGLDKQRRVKETAELEGWTVGRIYKAYRLGYMQAARVTSLMGDLGYKPEQANKLMSSADEQFDLDLRQEKLHAIKAKYHKGEIDGKEAKDRLIGMFMDEKHADKYIAIWSYEGQQGKHDATIGELIQGFKKGILDITQTTQALLRLDITPSRVALLLSIALSDLAEKEAKSAEQAKKQQEAMQAALEKQITAQLKRQKEIAKININLAKAQAKANSIMLKAQARVQALQLKERTKKATEAGKELAADVFAEASEKAKADLADKLLQLKQDFQKKTSARKAQYGIDVADVKDKTEKAQLKQTELADLAQMTADYLAAVEQAKDEAQEALGEAQTSRRSTIALAGQSAAQTELAALLASILSLAQDDAADVLTDAQNQAQVDQMPG